MATHFSVGSKFDQALGKLIDRMGKLPETGAPQERLTIGVQSAIMSSVHTGGSVSLEEILSDVLDIASQLNWNLKEVEKRVETNLKALVRVGAIKTGR